jgi:hypothetical protein
MPVVTLSVKLARAVHALFLAACLAALYTVSQLVVWLGLFAAFVPFIGDKPALAYLRFAASEPLDTAVVLGMAGYGLLHWRRWMREDEEEEARR